MDAAPRPAFYVFRFSLRSSRKAAAIRLRIKKNGGAAWGEFLGGIYEVQKFYRFGGMAQG